MSNICIFPGCKIGQYFSEELAANIPLEKLADNFSTYKLQEEFQKSSSMLSKSLSSGQMISKQSWARLKRLNSCQTSMEGLVNNFKRICQRVKGRKKVDQGCCLLQRTFEFLQKKIRVKLWTVLLIFIKRKGMICNQIEYDQLEKKKNENFQNLG